MLALVSASSESKTFKFMRSNWIIFTLAVLLAPATLLADPGPSQTTVFQAGREGFASCRIPSIILTSKGTLLALCEGRVASVSDSGDIHVLLRRSTDGGRTFSPIQIVWEDGKNTCGDPCPVLDRATGTIHLLMTHNLGKDRESQIIAGTAAGNRSVWITSSNDDGQTWSKPREITRQVKNDEWAWYATGPGIGIQIQHGPHAGRLVIPCDHIARGGGAARANSHIIYSDDHGQSWHIGGQPPAGGFNESQVVELPDGKLMLNMRNYGTKVRARGISISEDGGATFGPARADPALIEPVCQGSILRYSWPEQGKSRILFANPASTTQRRNLTVRLSYDEGQTWAAAKTIFSGPAAYSCMATLPDGSIGLLYECGEKSPYERIEFARFPLSWLTDGKDPVPPRGQ